MIEDIRLCFDDGLQSAVLAQKIRSEHLDCRLRTTCADGANGIGEMPRSTVREIVAVDRGHHDMRETKFRGCFRYILRLALVQRAGQPGLYIAERTGARAGVAQNHEGGVFLLPAPADVWGTCLLAHGVQAFVAHDLLRGEIAARD